jgi:hypothetical protein
MICSLCHVVSQQGVVGTVVGARVEGQLVVQLEGLGGLDGLVELDRLGGLVEFGGLVELGRLSLVGLVEQIEKQWVEIGEVLEFVELVELMKRRGLGPELMVD